MRKSVPVVVYEDGERKIIGTADLHVASNGDILIESTIMPQYAKRFGAEVTQISIGGNKNA